MKDQRLSKIRRVHGEDRLMNRESLGAPWKLKPIPRKKRNVYLIALEKIVLSNNLRDIKSIADKAILGQKKCKCPKKFQIIVPGFAEADPFRKCGLCGKDIR